MFVIKTIGSIILMLVVCKIVGVRQIAQITAYDYITGITIGSIAAEMAVQKDLPWYYPVVAVLIYAITTRLIAYLTGKSIKMRRIFTGKPTVMINHGKINMQSLKKHNYDVNDLLLECRIRGYFNLDDIESAVMETNGEISILPKSLKRPVNTGDLNLNPSYEGVCYNLIIDGKTMFHNLKEFGKDEIWLKKHLKEQGVSNEKDVLLAFGTPDGDLSVYKKYEDKTPPDCFM